MSTSIDRVQAELEALGYRTSVIETPRRPAVSFDYVVEAGSRKGTEVTVWISASKMIVPRIPSALGVRNAPAERW